MRTSRLAMLLAVLLVSSLAAGCLGLGGGDGDDGGDDGSDENQKPSAFFTKTCQGLTCTFDGSQSSDGDGTIVAYRWDVQTDGTRDATGATVEHTYPSSGTYTVTLTVEDDEGATARSQQSVTVTTPTDGNGDGDGNQTPDPPDDYHATYNGTVTLPYEYNQTFPVQFWRNVTINVTYNISTGDFPTGAASIDVNLTDPAGTETEAGTVDAQNPQVTWNLTEGISHGTWTFHADGQGLGDEDLGGTMYQLAISVTYS